MLLFVCFCFLKNAIQIIVKWCRSTMRVLWKTMKFSYFSLASSSNISTFRLHKWAFIINGFNISSNSDHRKYTAVDNKWQQLKVILVILLKLHILPLFACTLRIVTSFFKSFPPFIDTLIISLSFSSNKITVKFFYFTRCLILRSWL